MVYILGQKKRNEETIRTMLKVYANGDRTEVKRVMDFIHVCRREMYRPSGTSEEGNMALMAEIPAKLYWMMSACFGQEWRNDPDVAPVFWSMVPKMRMNGSQWSIDETKVGVDNSAPAPATLQEPEQSGGGGPKDTTSEAVP